MKIIYMVHKNRSKYSTIKTLYENLSYVFKDYIVLKRVYLEDLEKDPSLSIKDGDLYLTLYQDRIYDLKNHVNSLNKVIVLNRTIQKKYLDALLDIPANSTVLVVNDDKKSTLQLASTLYQIGLDHISLIPYIHDDKEQFDYKDIDYAITADELFYVPNHIKNIVNIGDRYIDSTTFISIINKLNINDEHITKNMFQYFQQIITTELGEGRSYFTDYLKGAMLERTIQNSDEAIILFDFDNKFLFANKKSYEFFDLENNESYYLDQLSIMQCGKNYIEFDDINYFTNKISISLLDEKIGYAVLLQSEMDIKNKEQKINKLLVQKGLVATYTFDDIEYESDIMKEIVNQAKKVASTDYSVVICGESGTGKELFAQSIHNSSKRKFSPFVAINCAAIPENLLESELFGYEKGAFTGANSSGKIGLFEQADKGTIFLDEIGDMPIYLQSRLLRVIQEQQIMKLGSDRVVNINVRIIAATNKNLEEMMQNGTFREDLYYRLSTLCLKIPALRKRENDVLLIAEKILSKENYTMSSAQKSDLLNYKWPGNIRELLNTMWYLQTFDKLPENIRKIESSKTCNDIENLASYKINSHQKLYIDILDIINFHSEDKHGIGRNSLLYELKNEDIHISDTKARTILSKMKSNNHILIQKGRAGNIITRNGINYLNSSRKNDELNT